jgi:predicted CXXCH cytochrome family protein
MRADLLALDARAPRDAGRRRPGRFGTLYRADFGGPGSTLLARAMSEKGLCGQCHVPAAGPGSLEVMPVTQPARYMIHGWFDHEDHKQETCTSCHAADTSRSARDLLLPTIGQCRECHQGESARTAEVPSSCAMCHSYHPRGGAAAAPRRIARR